MHRAQPRSRVTCGLVLATVGIVVVAPSARGQLRPGSTALASASPELIDRLRADPFTYFRFINRAWTARVCEVFADVTDAPIVRLHGDAHVEQFALTKDASTTSTTPLAGPLSSTSFGSWARSTSHRVTRLDAGS